MDAVVYDKIDKEAEKVREVLYGIYPQKTITGADVAYFTDGADDIPVKALTVGVEPVQDLHGYDHPWPGGSGKNLLPITTNSAVISGVTFTVNRNSSGEVESITANGTASSNAIFYLSLNNAFEITDDKRYIISGVEGGSANTYRMELYYRTAGGTYISTNLVYNGNKEFGLSDYSDAEKINTFIIMVCEGYTASNLVFTPMIRLATEADSTFEPYSNVCPISGWTGAKVTRTGKNLMKYPYESNRFVNNGITYIVNTDGTIVCNGVAGSGNSYGNLVSWKTLEYARLEKFKGRPLKLINLSGNVNVRLSLYARDANNTEILAAWAENSVRSITIPDKAETIYIAIRVLAGTQLDNFVVAPMIVLDEETDYSFEPYTANIYDITFPSQAGTVYGGTLDVASEKLVVDRKSVAYNGTESWQWSATSLRPNINNASNGMKQYGVLSCSHYPYSGSTTAIEMTVSTNAGGGSSAGYGIWFKDSVNAGSLEDWKAYLAAQNTAGTPVTVIYELATPIEFTLTPQEITTLLGVNSIWADTGAVKKLAYRADLGKYIADKITEMSANILNA